MSYSLATHLNIQLNGVRPAMAATCLLFQLKSRQVLKRSTLQSLEK
jgi:hypothetical protein